MVEGKEPTVAAGLVHDDGTIMQPHTEKAIARTIAARSG